jgi:hypothetical protein
MRHSRWRSAAGIGAGLWGLLLTVAPPALAQDFSAIALLSPRSGCALSAAETIRIRVVNYGPTLPGASFFSYEYRINGGTPVNEPVFMGNPVPPNGQLTYTFTTPADLSQPGIHQIEARIVIAADNNPANDLLRSSVQNWAPSVGGTVTAPAGTPSAGVLTLGGHTGDVLEWQQSADDLRWRALDNSTSQQAYAGLAEAVQLRALVRNGPCPDALSNSVRIVPDTIFANGFQP